jgi:hypothetical protein
LLNCLLDSEERRTVLMEEVQFRRLGYDKFVFSAGFVLGTIGVLWSVPQFGERNEELLEQPLMLVAVFLAARWIVRRAGTALASVEAFAVGLMALTLLMAAELVVVLELRGLSISEYIRTRDPISEMLAVLRLFRGCFGDADAGQREGEFNLLRVFLRTQSPCKLSRLLANFLILLTANCTVGKTVSVLYGNRQ